MDGSTGNGPSQAMATMNGSVGTGEASPGMPVQFDFWELLLPESFYEDNIHASVIEKCQLLRQSPFSYFLMLGDHGSPMGGGKHDWAAPAMRNS